VGLSRTELMRIAESVGERSGWDFARVRWDRDPTPWQYDDVVRRYLSRGSHVLDIGTGGGEVFLSMAADFGSGIGIDLDPGMIQVANSHRHEQSISHVRFATMDARELQFPDNAFDVVLNRHCFVDVVETARVLRPEGVFVTQQVAKNNTLNIIEAFGWTPSSFGAAWWQPITDLSSSFRELGFRIEVQADYDVSYWFRDLPSLVFWLKAVPLPEPFDPEKHWRAVKAIVEKNSTTRGIRTNEHRELLVVRKL
jgi:SAM-dependent methyltransferase